MKRSSSNDDGVSSVVGVMLLLAVLVILAGVFAAVVTGVISTQDPPVSAEFSYLTTAPENTYVFEMTAADGPVAKSKLKLVLHSRTNMSKESVIDSSGMKSPHDSAVWLGDLLRIEKPDLFNGEPYVLWMIYDADTGTLLSSGEIRG